MTELRIAFGPVHDSIAQLEIVAETIVQLNAVWFREHPEAPADLLDAGVRYRDPLLCEANRAGFCQTVLTADLVLERRSGTCIDLAAYYAGLWRSDGYRSRAKIIPDLDAYGNPKINSYHCLAVFYPNRGAPVILDAADQIMNGLRIEHMRPYRFRQGAA